MRKRSHTDGRRGSYVNDLDASRTLAAVAQSPGANTIAETINGISGSAGSLSGVLFSITAFAAACVLPLLVNLLDTTTSPKRIRPGSVHIDEKERTAVPETFTTMWAVSKIYFVVAVSLTSVVRSQVGGMMLTASLGVIWAITQWVPYCLLSRALEGLEQNALVDGDQGAPEAGAIMGLHNAAISAPQIVSALISSLFMGVLADDETPVVWTLCIGAGWMLTAAILCFKHTIDGRFAV